MDHCCKDRQQQRIGALLVCWITLKGRSVLNDLHRRIHRAAVRIAKHHDKWNVEDHSPSSQTGGPVLIHKIGRPDREAVPELPANI
jgi:hypothetical protein